VKHTTSLDKALQIIAVVAAEGEIGVRKLAERTGFPPSTIHRILAVLLRNHYLDQDRTSKEYRLSVRFLELAAQARGNWSIGAAARPVMQRLMEESEETVNLVVYDDMRAVYVEGVSHGGSLLRMFTQVGASVELYCTGVGKAYLATLEEADALAYFRRAERITYTANTIVEEEAFLRELAVIRAQGFAMDNQEKEKWVRCVATVIPHGHPPTWGLSLSGPSSRLTVAKAVKLGPIVCEAAAEIAARLGISSGGSQTQ
jgi:DNA-binding IclR family transcriptional regulator